MGVIEPSLLLGAAVLYLGLLFLVAELAERGHLPERLVRSRWVFSLSLGVYATSWTFFGSVGMADDRGYAYLTIYMGVSLACLMIPVLWLPLLRVTRQHRLASVPDLFAFRYRSQAVAVLVTLFVIAASIPYLALQIRALSDSAVVLSGKEEAASAAAAFTGLITIFALLFGARHLTGNEQHRGMVVAIALETVVKLVALVVIAGVAVIYGFGGFEGMADWASEHPHKVERLFAPVREDSFTTLLLLSFAAGFLLPRQFHLAFAERPDDEAMLGATWRFPLILLVLCLAVPPILWAGQQVVPGADPDTYALHLALGHPVFALVVYIGGLAASSGMMIVTSVALGSMAVNHLLLPWWRPQGGELFRTVAWARRLVVGVVLLIAHGFFLLVGHDSRLASLGLIAFVAMAQLLPGVISVLYYRGASRAGLFLGLLGGVAGWLVMLGFPRIGLEAPALAIAELARQVDPAWTDTWTLATVVSLGLNVLLFVAGSIFFPPSQDELVAAEQCGLDVEAGARRLRRPASPGLLKARLGPLLGAQTATRLVDTATRESGLVTGEAANMAELRTVEEHLEASLTALLGPLLGPAVLDGVSAGATSHLAAQVRFLDEQRQTVPRGPLAQVELVRRYLKGVLEDLPVGVCALGPHDEILVWNRALQDLSGLYARDWLGHELEELPEPFGPAIIDWVSGETSREVSFETDVETKLLSVSVTALAGGGRVVTLEDLTTRRRLERQVVHEDRLRSLGQLTAAIGHEIGNPLTGVLMLARNLAAEQTPEDLPERLGMVVSEAEKIESIVQSMSSFARAGTDEALADPKTRRDPVVLLEVVEDALRLVRIGRRGKGILWSYDCGRELVVLGDRQQLTQVLVNLLNNACDASTDGQPIRVSGRSVGRFIELDVIDRGEGIPESVAQRLFEPFFTTKGPGAGTGLGLAVSEGIVRGHGGRLEVFSEHGEGTTMRVVLRQPDEAAS